MKLSQVKFLIFLAMYFACLVLRAQNPFWDNHVSTSNISGIAKEGNNYWLTTHGGGLVKFNAVSLSSTFFRKDNSPIPSVFLSCVVVDAAGNKWIGTDDGINGLMRYDGSNSWTIYNTQNSPIPSNKILSLFAKGNILWIGTDAGLAKFDGNNWFVYTTSTYSFSTYNLNNIRDILVDTAGFVWVCAYGNGLMKFDGLNWTVFTNTNSGIHCGPNNEITSVTIDSAGNLYVGHVIGYSSFDGSNWTYYGNNLFSDGVKFIRSDLQGNLFYRKYQGLYKKSGAGLQSLGIGAAGTYYCNTGYSAMYYTFLIDGNNIWVPNMFGLAKYDSLWTDYSYAIESQLKCWGISDCHYIASTNTMNIGTAFSNSSGNHAGAGLATLSNPNWQQTDILDTCGQDNIVYCIEGDANNLWMGIRNGVCYFNGNTYQKSYFSSCISFEKTLAIDVSTHGHFAGTNQGNLYELTGSVWSPVPGIVTPTGPLTYISSLKNHGGKLFVGSRSGLISLDPINGIVQYSSLNSGLPSDTINDILVDYSTNDLWLATDKGLVKTDLINWTTYTNGVPGKKITCLAQDGLHNIWIGTSQNGIAMFDGSVFYPYHMQNSGITDDRITDILVDNDNSIWIGTAEGGLCVYKYGIWLSMNPSNEISNNDQTANLSIRPNPVYLNALIDITLQQEGEVSMFIYNSMGQKIKTFLLNDHDSKSFTIPWDGCNDEGFRVKPGLYLFNLITTNGIITKRVVVIN